jgi:hypothetical protein
MYAIHSLKEAKAYLDHPVLGPRLVELSEIVLTHPDIPINTIMGWSLDAMKFKSSMSLFSLVAPPRSVFHRVLDQFFEGKRCRITLKKFNIEFNEKEREEEEEIERKKQAAERELPRKRKRPPSDDDDEESQEEADRTKSDDDEGPPEPTNPALESPPEDPKGGVAAPEKVEKSESPAEDGEGKAADAEAGKPDSGEK